MPNPVNLRKVAETKRPVKRIDEDVLHTARNWRRRGSLGFNPDRPAEPPSPFVFPRFPPQVERAVERAGKSLLAQDADFRGTFGWAADDPMYVQYSEGVAFLGYSYLATLAQRAEYRVAVETVAAEMTREWVEIKVASGDESKTDLKRRIEDRMEELHVQHCFRQVAEGDGFFGRAHLYLDTGATDDADELITDLGNGRTVMSNLKVGPHKNQRLIRLQPVEATWVYPTFYESIDPLKRDWYNPVTWYVMSREVHRSRLLTFVGRPVPDILKPAYSFGGLAMSAMLKPYVDNWLRTRQAVGDLIQAFTFNVLRTNLDATTGTGGEALFGRIDLFNNIRNNQGTIVIDKDSEDWSNVSIPVGSLDHLQAQAQEHMACLVDDTEILVDRGLVPICDVRVTDRVMTRNGWAPLAWSGKTGQTDTLIEIRTEHTTLRCTPDHPIYLLSTNGFVNAEFVCIGDHLCAAPISKATSTDLRSFGAGVGGVKPERAVTAMSKAAVCFTGLFGKFISDLSRRVWTSITSTVTAPIINYPISNSRPAPSTISFIWRMAGAGVLIDIRSCSANSAWSAVPSFIANGPRGSIAANVAMLRRIGVGTVQWRGIKGILRSVWSAARNFTLPLRVSDGFIAARIVPVAFTIGAFPALLFNRVTNIPRFVGNAAKNSRLHWSGRDGGSTAADNVRTKPITVVSVRRIPADEPVYNLEVAPGYLPEFYANGILVHNSISRIPLVKLLGIQPAGLNATSEGELIAFEDWIASFQEILFRDALRSVIDFIQLSLFGEVDEDIDFDFKPLRQLKPIEQAQLQSVVAQTRSGYMELGAVSGEEVREALAEDKESPFGGLDLKQPLPAPPGMPEMPGLGMPGQPPPTETPPGAPGSPVAGRKDSPALPPLPPPPRPPRPPRSGSTGFPRDSLADEALEVIPVDSSVLDVLASDQAPRRRIRRPRSG